MRVRTYLVPLASGVPVARVYANGQPFAREEKGRLALAALSYQLR
jgi:hypothetical protein